VTQYIAVALPNPESHARQAAGTGSLYRSSVIIIAQVIRAILLAKATAAIFGDRRASSETSQGRLVPCC
jgi:hypothetical protein